MTSTLPASSASPFRKDFLLSGRVLAQNIIDRPTGEILNANDEITESLLQIDRSPASKSCPPLYTSTTSTAAVHLENPARRRRPSQRNQAATRRHLPHDAPGEPPTEEAVEMLFHGLFYSDERYDLSASAA